MENKIVPEKGKIEYVIGIDFGHGETSAAICRIDSNKDPEDIDMTGTGKKTIPSTLYIEKNEGEEDVYIGQDAIAKYGSGGKGSFHAYFKQSIEEYDEAKIPSIKVMRLFMSEVYKAICHKRAGELMEGDRIKQNHVVFIACPSQSQKWGGQAMQNYVRLALDAGLPIAGVTIEDKFSMSGIVRESRAAYIRMLQKEEASQKALKGILVIDYGSSTIDITYYKEGEKPIDKGYPIGASHVEQKIQDFLKEYHDDLDEDQNPDALKLIERDYPYMNTQCLYRIRSAKEVFYEQYSSANCIQVAYRFMPRLNAKKIDVEIPKETINNKILTKYIKEVESAFEDFRDKVINNNKVTLMVLTGGASRMDFVEASAKSVFGNDVVLLPPQDPSLTVSNGIATAGRADVKMYHLIQEIRGNASIMKPSLYSKVKSAMVDEITNKVINVLSSEYYTFKDGSYPYSYSDKKCTIKLLEKNVKSAIDNINYKEALNNIYVNVLSNHINSSVSPVLRKYTQTYFPTFKVDAIRSFNAPSGLTLNVSSSQLSTLDSIVKESVNTIEEGFFEFVGKTVLNLGVAAILGVGAVVDNIAIAGIRGIQGLIGIDKKKRVEYISLDDYTNAVSDLTMSYRDNETNLEYEKRKKVYTEFQNRESGYKSQIKNNIENHFPLEINDIETPGYQLIQHYLFNEFNHIQMLIK